MQDTCPSNLASGAAAAAVSAPEVQAPLALPALVQRSVQLHRMQADGKAVQAYGKVPVVFSMQ